MGVYGNLWSLLGCPHNKVCNVLKSILTPLRYSWKLPSREVLMNNTLPLDELTTGHVKGCASLLAGGTPSVLGPKRTRENASNTHSKPFILHPRNFHPGTMKPRRTVFSAALQKEMSAATVRIVRVALLVITVIVVMQLLMKVLEIIVVTTMVIIVEILLFMKVREILAVSTLNPKP